MTTPRSWTMRLVKVALPGLAVLSLAVGGAGCAPAGDSLADEEVEELIEGADDSKADDTVAQEVGDPPYHQYYTVRVTRVIAAERKANGNRWDWIVGPETDTVGEWATRPEIQLRVDLEQGEKRTEGTYEHGEWHRCLIETSVCPDSFECAANILGGIYHDKHEAELVSDDQLRHGLFVSVIDVDQWNDDIIGATTVRLPALPTEKKRFAIRNVGQVRYLEIEVEPTEKI